MLLSRGCEYGLRAAIYVAHREEDSFVPIREISSELDISFHFLTKVLQQMNEASIVDSYRGPRGGVRLSRPASEISLKDIVMAIDGPGLFAECVLGLPGCGDQTPCPLHADWSIQRERLGRMLDQT
ncbi:MAG: Rrf2 family transcriptional regulator, partial [Rhodothermales bacterium]|nr:Rrf2 family transcriptional regulator [Rhodothermales bacterium]